MKTRQTTLFKSMTAFALALMMTMAMIPACETTTEAAIAADPVSNPVIVEDSSVNIGQKTTWDCVWFGSYPQTEIVESLSGCGTYGKSFYDESDCIVDSELYNKLKNATEWVNDEITLDGTKYCKVRRPTAFSMDGDSYYSWDSNYHYFRYDPIKWRVLNVDGDQALLLADKVLDDRRFNSYTFSNTKWEDSIIRSWLNGYDGSENYDGTDFSTEVNFKDSAFTEREQTALLDTELDNDTSGPQSLQYGGEDTVDKVFLLAEYDLTSDNAYSYGFSKKQTNGGFCDASRCSYSSTYAKAKGHKMYDQNYGTWFLRSPMNSSEAYRVEYYGSSWGAYASTWSGIRPAVTLDLTSSVWSNAGTVCTDGTVNETAYVDRDVCKDGHTWVTEPGTAATCTEDGTKEAIVCSRCGDFQREHEVIPAFGHIELKASKKAATLTADGTNEGYYCSICNTVFEGMEVIPQIKSAALSFDTADYDGETKSPEVLVYDREGKQLTEDIDYKVEVPSGRTDVGTYQYKVIFQGDYSGSTKLTLTINSLSSASNKASLSYTTAVYDGKVKSPTIKVTDGNGKTLTKNKDYTISTPSGRKNVGVYTYKITYTGKYTKATKKLTLTINPKGTTISKLTALTKSFKVTWKKYSTQTSGYQLQYSTSSAFKSAKTVTVSGTSTTSKTIKSLKAKTKYYVQIRTYKTVSGKKYYSAWSAKKYVKTK